MKRSAKFVIFKGFAAVLIAIQVSASEKPNILFFLVDDLGARDLACAGSNFYQTPSVDALAAAGMSFSQAYAAHPRCVPSRYAVMTGTVPARSGVPGRRYNIEPEERLISEALKDGGYATFFTGKWHLSKKPEQEPQSQGFDINIAGGAAGAPGSYFYPYLRSANKHHRTKAPVRGLEDGEEGEYLTDRLTDETIQFLRAHSASGSDAPFFAMVSHYAVHTPLEAKKEDTKVFEKIVQSTEYSGEPYITKDGTTKTRQDHAVYAAMVKSVDDSLGRIMDTLEQLGIANETLVIFTSDHGGLSNRGVNNQRELATSNLPLRAGKGHCYEGGIRVPLIVRWPGVAEAGSSCSVPVIGMDHFPTLLESAGLQQGEAAVLDGVSYLPLLKGGRMQRPGPLFWHSPKGRPNSTGDTNCSVIREGDFKLFHFYDEDRVELYNIARDPYEETNLAEARPETAEKLLAALHTWKAELGVFIDQR